MAILLHWTGSSPFHLGHFAESEGEQYVCLEEENKDSKKTKEEDQEEMRSEKD